MPAPLPTINAIDEEDLLLHMIQTNEVSFTSSHIMHHPDLISGFYSFFSDIVCVQGRLLHTINLSSPMCRFPMRSSSFKILPSAFLTPLPCFVLVCYYLHPHCSSSPSPFTVFGMYCSCYNIHLLVDADDHSDKSVSQLMIFSSFT